MTIRPAQSGNNQKLYSLPNIHGDTMATTDAAGALSGTFSYDPFGNKTSASLPNNTATGSTYAWVGQHEKLTEADFTLTPTEMGARVYLSSIGRFLQVDPVEGGVQNNYVYPPDAVNDFDLDGQFVVAAIVMAALDTASLAYSANEFRKDRSLGNSAALGSEFMPMVPGIGAIRGGAKGARWADDAAKRIMGKTAAKSVAKEASKLGYIKRIPAHKAPFNSHKQPVFQKGNRYITRDVDGHKGGYWKVYERRGGRYQRTGTYDKKLKKRIGR